MDACCAQENSITTKLKIPDMDCASEVSLIQKKLELEPGIVKLSFDIETRVLAISHVPTKIDSQRIIQLLDTVGMQASALDGESEVAAPSSTRTYITLALSGVFAFGAEFLELGMEAPPEYLVLGLAVVSVLLSGLSVYKKGLVALSKGQLNINALMSIAVTGALFIKQWPEAAMVMFLFSVAELIEAKAFDRARNAFKNLLELAPDKTIMQTASGSWETVPTAEVPLNSSIRVRPGQRISLDGVILKGTSSINQAPITGESVLIEKTVGDKVFAGSINETAELEFKSTSLATNSTLAKIVEAVDAAQGNRAPTQRFIDNFSAYYTPAIFFIALGVAILPPLLGYGEWLAWLYKALVLLVIACPCALVISTPVTIVSGLSGAAKHGILIKGGAYLEKGKDLKVVALDKTGTITFGKPVETDFKIIAPGDSFSYRTIAASLAARSDHPVSQAIANKGKENGLALLEVQDFAAIAGRGVKGVVNGVPYFLANHRFIEELKICSQTLEAILEGFEREGKTVTILATAESVLAVFAVIDTVRPSSKQAVAALNKLGVKTVMLSGDNQLTAQRIAKEVGIDEAKGSMLPEDKMRVIKDFTEQKLGVGMVGDGINDAPALATADIGFSMGVAGTDVAIETSDVAIMDDDLRKVPSFIKISKNTSKVLMQNITLAIGIKAVFFVLTLMGLSSMWMAVFADTGASLLVVLNGLRLNR